VTERRGEPAARSHPVGRCGTESRAVTVDGCESGDVPHSVRRNARFEPWTSHTGTCRGDVDRRDVHTDRRRRVGIPAASRCGGFGRNDPMALRSCEDPEAPADPGLSPSAGREHRVRSRAVHPLPAERPGGPGGRDASTWWPGSRLPMSILKTPAKGDHPAHCVGPLGSSSAALDYPPATSAQLSRHFAVTNSHAGRVSDISAATDQNVHSTALQGRPKPVISAGRRQPMTCDRQRWRSVTHGPV